LAADVLLLAIEDVRQTRNPKKREDTKRWLLSKDAGLFFDVLEIQFISDLQFDIRAWIEADCPQVGKR
jgi:hypothetical protein